ncbi:hypothetical protein OH768_00905 [Streptomyces sp. NBC_01622]|uniref:hypothetical protein n=1 Tax=Streptomyces sp. NBC_01622 TaxID=2975903 RepID=UPI003863AB94|nr:hypothetical protein OH768_00905 [Streptomyces sp. NBC_01622]
MIGRLLARADQFIGSFFPPKPEVSHEHNRLAQRVGDPERWAEIVSARGLSGLVLGAASAWEYGVVLRFRLLGKLTFGDVEDKAMHLATALGLVRARTMGLDGIHHFEVDAETIALGMIKTHRKWGGSVIFVDRTDRSDRVDLWIGYHDELAPALHELDAEAARLKAAEEAEKITKRREAERTRDARMTGTGSGTHGQTVGIPEFRTLADLHVHEPGSVPHGTADLCVHEGDGTAHTPPSQRARELIDMGVRDAAALARQLEREGQRVPSSSYLRRLVRETR